MLLKFRFFVQQRCRQRDLSPGDAAFLSVCQIRRAYGHAGPALDALPDELLKIS